MYRSVATGKYYTATESVTEKEDTQIEEGTSEHLNGLLCQLKAHIEFAVSHNPLVKDVLGIVATLGNVHDENLSRSVVCLLSYFRNFSLYGC